MDEKFMKTHKTPEYLGKPLSGILSGADFPVRTSQLWCPSSCCPLIFLPLPYPTSTETKKNGHVQGLLSRQRYHVIFSVVKHTNENHLGLSKYSNMLEIAGYADWYQVHTVH